MFPDTARLPLILRLLVPVAVRPSAMPPPVWTVTFPVIVPEPESIAPLWTV